MKKSLPIALAALMHCHANASDIKVPAGFEALVQGQLMWLDVQVYGHSLGLYEAKVDLDSVQFLKPGDITEAVKRLYRLPVAEEQTFNTGIQSSLKRNGHLACSTNGRAPGCDFLETDSIALIYDENNATVRLFFASKGIARKTEQQTYHQVAPESRNALIHQQSMNFIADENYQSASLRGNGALGITKNSYANVDWNWRGQRYHSESHQDIEVTNAFVRHDIARRYYVQGGLMDSRDIFSNAGGNINLSQLPIGKIQGVRTGSTLSWVNQDALARGTPLPVFLSQNARVDAYRDNKLLASFYLDAGSHELDTRNFPAGSYTVTLRIFENNQLARTETVPYTHIGNTQHNSTQWFVQAGQLDESTTPHRKDTRHIAQAGARIPLAPNLGITVGGAVMENAHYWESAIDWQHGFHTGPIDGVMTTKASYLYSDDGSRGNTQQLSYNDGFSLSYYRSQIASPDCHHRAQTQYSFTGCYTSTSAMFSMPIKQWNMRAGYISSRNQGRYVLRNQLSEHDSERDTGAPWEQVFVTRSRSQTWQTGVSRIFNVNGASINASVNAFRRNDRGFGKTDQGGFVTVSVARSRAGTGSHINTTFGLNGQSSRQGRDQFGYSASYNRYTPDNTINEMGGSLNGINTENVTGSAWGSSSGRYGNGSLNLTHAWNNRVGNNTLSTSGSYNSSLLIDRTGLTVGPWGDGTPSSAVSVALNTVDEGSSARVDASLSTGAQTEIGHNSKALLTVPGYHSTTLSIIESANAISGSDSEIHKGAGTQSFFMPPGRVLHQDVSVSARYTWLGKLIDQDNRPLEGITPLNAASWAPFPDGGFMMETQRPIETLYAIKDNTLWQCRLEIRTQRDVVRHVGATRCARTEMAALPEREKKRARLQLAETAEQQVSGEKNG